METARRTSKKEKKKKKKEEEKKQVSKACEGGLDEVNWVPRSKVASGFVYLLSLRRDASNS